MILLLLALAAASHDAVGVRVAPSQAVPLASVGTLRFEAAGGVWPQLACVGGAAAFDAYRLPAASCTPAGEHWSCEADPAPGYRLTNLRVVCQGARRPDYVQPETCTMQYELEHDRPPLRDAVGPVGWAAVAVLLGCGACACTAVLAVFGVGRYWQRRPSPWQFDHRNR